MRIAKAMAHAGLCSRRDAEAWIAAGRVLVNGKVQIVRVGKSFPASNPLFRLVATTHGGYTLALPEEDRTLYAKSKFEADLAGLLGGRAAEEIVFKDVTTGASNDLERATKMARSMVTR